MFYGFMCTISASKAIRHLAHA